MAHLVNCSLCGRKVSNMCSSCPGCGHNVYSELQQKELEKQRAEQYERSKLHCYYCGKRYDHSELFDEARRNKDFQILLYCSYRCQQICEKG